MSTNGHANGFAEVAPKLPPHNIEAEEGVIGSVLLENDRLDGRVVSRLEPGHFYRDKHQIVWGAVLALKRRGEPVDEISLSEALERADLLKRVGGYIAIAEFLGRVPHAANSEYYGGVVMSLATRRNLLEFGEDLLKTRDDTLHTPEELLATFSDRFARIEVVPDDEDSEVARPWPAPLAEAAFHGLAGDIVRLIEPNSETDPAAILGQLLVAFGSVIGRNAHWRVDRTEHYTNLYLCLVGASSKARKGMSWDHILWLMKQCDEYWVSKRVLSGIATGEGLVFNIRDPVIIRVKKKDPITKVEHFGDEMIDEGEPDKRALWVEPEFGSSLGIMNRDGNSLSGKFREAFDHGNVRSSPKTAALRATNGHVSLIGHVTPEEVRLRLTRNDAGNGFANRILWLCCKRQRLLPHGGNFDQAAFKDVIQRLMHAVQNAQAGVYLTPMERDDQANELWESVYGELSTPKPGLLGAVTGRAEALTMRLACIYALFDRARSIERVHLEAGLAVWHRCDHSASYVFGDALGDPNAEKLLKALAEAGDVGLTRTQIRQDVFKGHKSKEKIAAILEMLASGGMAESVSSEPAPGSGPVAVTWKSLSRRKTP